MRRVKVIVCAVVGLLVACFWPMCPEVRPRAWAGESKKVEKVEKAAPAACCPFRPEVPLDARLDRCVTLEFVETPLDDVFEYLSDVLKTTIHAKWRRLDEVGVAKDAPVNLRLRDVPAEFALRLLLDQLGEDLDFTVQEGILLVSTAEDLSRRMAIEVYNVRDLLEGAEEEDPAATLIDTITGTVAPTTWDTVGGPAAISGFKGLLVVRQSAAVQAEVEKTLDMLRKADKSAAHKR